MGERIDINGHPTWIDDRGSGDETVLLLHGGMSHSDELTSVLAEPLLERYRVVAFDRKAHGYTADAGGPFHYADMAGDTIDVLEQVVGGAAHLIGWSDGGIIALLVAMRRPDLVGRIVAIGANYHFDGLHPVDLDDNSSVGELIMQGYAERSPDGAEHFAELFERFQTMVTTEPTLTKDELATITAPALIMAGDDDMVRLDHTCALYEALPAGQLVIVPGTSHVLPLERPAEVARIIMDFLASEVPPATFLPIRRAR